MRAELLAHMLLEDVAPKGSLIVFGQDYPEHGQYFDSIADFREPLEKQGFVDKEAAAAGTQAKTKMAALGLSADDAFVQFGADTTDDTFIIKKDEKSFRIVGQPFVTTKDGLEHIQSRFGLEPDSIVTHQNRESDNVKKVRLRDLVQLSSGEMEKAAAAQDKLKVPRYDLKQRALDFRKKRTVLGYSKPKVSKNPRGKVSFYPIDVQIGLSTRAPKKGERGPVVIDVADGSPAARAGFRKGDRIIRIARYFPKVSQIDQTGQYFGPHSIRTQKDWKFIMGQFLSGHTYAISVVRGDAEHELPLVPKTIQRPNNDIHISASEFNPPAPEREGAAARRSAYKWYQQQHESRR